MEIVECILEDAGANVTKAYNGLEAYDVFMEYRAGSFDVILMDIMMPKLDGFEVTKIIRASSDVPIILLTALQGEDDILNGYNLHVDDYITKPFNPKVLIAKVNNLMLRLDKENSLKVEYKIGDLSFDFVNNEVFFLEKKLELTKTEFKMLVFLAKNINKVCSRELLLDEVWGMDVYVDDRIVDAYIKKLRKLIAPKKYIKTVFGVGYRFSLEE